MTHQRLRAFRRARPLAAALLLALISAPALAGPPTPLPVSASGRLTVVERVLTQDQGDWQIDYCLKYEGSKPLVLAPGEMGARVAGWLSNSRVAVHANPRRSECTVANGGPMATAEVIASSEEVLSLSGAGDPPGLGGQGVRRHPRPRGRPRAADHRHRRARRPAPGSGSGSSTSTASTATTIHCSAAATSSSGSAPTRSATYCRSTESNTSPSPRTPGPSPPTTTRTPVTSCRPPTASCSKPGCRATSISGSPSARSAIRAG